MKWFISSLRKYAQFSGRAHRREFWWASLIGMLILLALWIIEHTVGEAGNERELGLLTTTFGLATLLPSIALCVRRLHDCGKSGWWYLMILIPYIGLIALTVLFAQPGDAGDNEYGSPPR